MNINKKTSIWEYIKRLYWINATIGIIEAVVIVALVIFSAPWLGRLGYLIFPSVIFNFFNLPDRKPDLGAYWFSGVLVELLITFIICISILIINFIKEQIAILSVFNAATRLPLSKDELEENGIHTMDDMTEFLKSNVFKDVRHGVHVYEIYSELKTCYSLVYCNDFKTNDLKKNREKKESDLYIAANQIIEWIYNKN